VGGAPAEEEEQDMKLYQGWQSSSSWRVRWALALKRVPYQAVFVDVAAGEHRTVLAARNPMLQVPTLELDDGRLLTESSAIIEWLDETVPDPPLLPGDPFERARARALVQLVNAGIQPLQNTIVRLAYSPDRAAQDAWCRRWIERGLAAYEAHMAGGSSRYSMGDRITIADLFLIPQLRNAERHGADITHCPRILAIYAACLETPEARQTQPSKALLAD
jgi:maleylacetoacetate isomerase